MNKHAPLNEAAIKCALQEGLITPKEARNMLRVYLNKSGFSTVPKPAVKRHQFL